MTAVQIGDANITKAVETVDAILDAMRALADGLRTGGARSAGLINEQNGAALAHAGEALDSINRLLQTYEASAPQPRASRREEGPDSTLVYTG